MEMTNKFLPQIYLHFISVAWMG